MKTKTMILTSLALTTLALALGWAGQEPRQNLTALAYNCQALNMPCSLPVTFKGWPQ